MKTALASFFLVFAGVSVAEYRTNAKAFGPDQLKAFNAPDAMSMEVIKQQKLDHVQNNENAGVYALDRYKPVTNKTPCVDGKAGEYKCKNIDLNAFMRHQDMGSRTRVGNDIWGKL
jgi:hypothetical protein